MKVWVSGASGYIGSVLCDYLAWRGHMIHRCRVPDFEFLHQADRFIHLAGASKAGECSTFDAELSMARTACSAIDPRKIIYASSCAVYRNSDKPQNESSPTGPACTYGATKLACEQLVLAGGGTSIRCGAVCGPSRRFRADIAINGMVSDAVRRGEIRVFGPGDWRPHVHILDACACYAMAAESVVPLGVVNCVGWNAPMLEVAERIRLLTGARINSDQPAPSNRSYWVTGRHLTNISMGTALSDLLRMLKAPAVSADDEARANAELMEAICTN